MQPPIDNQGDFLFFSSPGSSSSSSTPSSSCDFIADGVAVDLSATIIFLQARGRETLSVRPSLVSVDLPV